MSLYNYFVTAPYAALAIQVVMLFIYSGLACTETCFPLKKVLFGVNDFMETG